MSAPTTTKKKTKKRQTKKETRGRSLGVKKKTSGPTPPLVDEFRRTYAKVVQQAHEHAEHTATKGWQELFSDHLEHDEKTRKVIAEELRRFAKCLVNTEEVIDPRDLAPLASAKRRASDHLVAMLTWREDVVSKVAGVAKEAQEIINAFRSRAHASPLFNEGLGTAMDVAIDEAPVIRWDDDTGVITVEEQDVS